MPIEGQTQWWAGPFGHENLSALWEFLDEKGILTSDGPAYFMEKPWKWNLEYDVMLHLLFNKGPLNSTPEEVLDFITEHELSE